MPWVKIIESVLDLKPGSTGVIYFKTEDGVNRKTPELQPVVFNSVCAVLERQAIFDTQDHVFRSSPGQRVDFIKDNKGFSEKDLMEFENYETWNLTSDHI